MDLQHRGRTVVVGIDGSESALRAVRWAAAEAARRRVPLRVVTAFQWTQDHAVGQIELGRSYRDIMLDESRRLLAEALAVAEGAADGLDVEQQLIAGFPIPVLTAESRRAQLLVIGDRGLGGVTGLAGRKPRPGRRRSARPAAPGALLGAPGDPGGGVRMHARGALGGWDVAGALVVVSAVLAAVVIVRIEIAEDLLVRAFGPEV
jgi:nucleotide-binding universal stress UspA family protein